MSDLYTAILETMRTATGGANKRKGPDPPLQSSIEAEFGGVETAISKMAGEEIAGLSDVPKRKDDQAALPGDPRRRVVDG